MDFRVLKILAFDDGFFPPHYKGGRGETLVVGISTYEDMVLDKITYKRVTVDARETTPAIIEQALLHKNVDIILLDGVTYAGFDVIDPDHVHEELDIPVIVVQQYPLDLEKVEKALKKHFSDWRERYHIIEKVVLRYKYLATRWKIIQYYAIGMGRDKAEKVLLKMMIYSPIPEPLRIAHLIASTLSQKLYARGYI